MRTAVLWGTAASIFVTHASALRGLLRVELVFFFYSIKLRIAGSEEKTANFLWVSWLVSGVECGVVTLDFGVGA
jgi:hypothetical protein